MSARTWFYTAAPFEELPSGRISLTYVAIDTTEVFEPGEPGSLPIMLGLGNTRGVPHEQRIGAIEARRIAAALVAAAEASEREATTTCRHCDEPIAGEVPECLPCHMSKVRARRQRMREGVISE